MVLIVIANINLSMNASWSLIEATDPGREFHSLMARLSKEKCLRSLCKQVLNLAVVINAAKYNVHWLY